MLVARYNRYVSDPSHGPYITVVILRMCMYTCLNSMKVICQVHIGFCWVTLNINIAFTLLAITESLIKHFKNWNTTCSHVLPCTRHLVIVGDFLGPIRSQNCSCSLTRNVHKSNVVTPRPDFSNRVHVYWSCMFVAEEWPPPLFLERSIRGVVRPYAVLKGYSTQYAKLCYVVHRRQNLH